MDAINRELWASRIQSGTVRLKLFSDGQERLFVVRAPTVDERYAAAEAAVEAGDEAASRYLYSDDDILAFLRENELWDDAREELLKQVTKDIETLKVKLFQMAFRTRERDAARKLLAVAKQQQLVLLGSRHAYDHLTIMGQSVLAKSRYLVGRCLLRGDGTQVWNGEDFWKSSDPLLDLAVQGYNQSRPQESVVREVARNEPWRSVWACRHSEGRVFGIPAVGLSDDQRFLTVWSRVYDNAYEDPECPPEVVIEDDDMFDGWLIIKRRERDKSMKKKRVVDNEKIAKAGEVFIVAESADDVVEIEELNDENAAITKKRRMNAVKAKGFVQEAEMPDSKEKILAQFAMERRGK